MPSKTRASSRKDVKVAEVSDEVDVASLVDLNAILRSKKVSKSLSKKRSKKKVKATLSSVEVAMHAEEDDKMGDEDPCVKCDLSAEELDVSDDDEPPKDYTFGDAKQQALMEEEHVKQHLANIRKGIKRQRHAQNERNKQQKVQKLSDTSAKLSDDVLAQISLKKSQRKKKMVQTSTTKKRSHTKAKAPQTDQCIAVKQLTEDIVPVAASYEVAVQFRQSCYYGSRHSRVSGKHHFLIHLSKV